MSDDVKKHVNSRPQTAKLNHVNIKKDVKLVDNLSLKNNEKVKLKNIRNNSENNNKLSQNDKSKNKVEIDNFKENITNENIMKNNCSQINMGNQNNNLKIPQSIILNKTTSKLTYCKNSSVKINKTELKSKSLVSHNSSFNNTLNDMSKNAESKSNEIIQNINNKPHLN